MHRTPACASLVSLLVFLLSALSLQSATARRDTFVGHPAEEIRAYGAGGDVGLDYGSFVQKIPLILPPAGSGGSAPTLALNYDSHDGNGHLGMGWSLAGLSSIERCGRTLAQDEQLAPVQYTTADRFCMNGSRLVAVAGDYGRDGTRYRTEIESWRDVTSIGFTNDGPISFVARGPDGTTFEFGTTDESRVEAAGRPQVRVWALARVVDVSGNVVLYEYDELAEGEYRIRRVSWDDRTHANALRRAVTFEYEGRPDRVARFMAGSIIATRSRLRTIRTTINGNLVRQWSLAYDKSFSTNRSRLVTLTMSDAAGNAMPPHRFTWQEGIGRAEQSWMPKQEQGDLHDFKVQRWLVDLNADGLVDYVAKSNDTQVHWDLNQRTSWGRPMTGSVGHFATAEQWFVDVDGDGTSDFVAKNPDNLIHWNLSLGETGGAVVIGPLVDQGGLHEFGEDRWFADINGDGKADYIMKRNTDAIINWNLGTSNGATASHWGPPRRQPGASFGQARWVIDLNGDGKADYVAKDDTTRSMLWNLSLGNGATESHWGETQQATEIHGPGRFRFFADINGDGLPDYVVNNGDGELHWHVNTGAGFGPQRNQGGLHLAGHDRWLADLNGDGKADWIVRNNSDNRISWNLSIGDGTTDNQFRTVEESLQVDTDIAPFADERWLFDVNGDGKIDYVSKFNDTALRWNLSEGMVPDLLVGVVDPVGAELRIEYEPLTFGSVYTLGKDATYPVRDISYPLYVVARLRRSDGIGGMTTATYLYRAAKYDLLRRIWLGFESITVREPNGITREMAFRQDFPLHGQIRSTKLLQSNGNLIAEERQEWAATRSERAPVFTVTLASYVATDFELDGAIKHQTTEQYAYDEFANPTKTTTTLSDGYTLVTDNQYRNNEATAILGLLVRSTRSAALASNGTSAIRRYDADHDEHGNVIRETLESGTANERATLYEYDQAGRLSRKRIEGPSFAARETKFTYDDFGFLATFIDELGFTERSKHDPASGVETEFADPNGLTTTRTLDGFGRVLIERMPDRREVKWEYAFGTAAPAVITMTAPTGAIVETHLDVLGRLSRVLRSGFGNRRIVIGYTYDADGFLIARTRPFYEGDVPPVDRYQHDLLGRVTMFEAAGGSRTVFHYHGNQTTITDPRGFTTTTTYNQRDLPVSRTDALGGITRYDYTPFGELTSFVNTSGHVTALGRDPEGSLRSTLDPDSGLKRFTRNALGEVVAETAGNGDEARMEYDGKGRLTARTTRDGTSRWTYDVATHGINSIARIEGPNGFLQTHEYSGEGRLIAVGRVIGGKNHRVAFEYDPNGRVIRVRYPDGFVIRRGYDLKTGTLTRIADASDRTLWISSEIDAFGRVVAEQFGNGVVTQYRYDARAGSLSGTITASAFGGVQSFTYGYDAAGNLTSRVASGIATEFFAYDPLQRLQTWRADIGSFRDETFAYGDDGNIEYRAGVARFHYEQGFAAPHATTRASVDSRAGRRWLADSEFTYDRSGNMLSGLERQFRYDGDGRTIGIDAPALGMRRYNARTVDVRLTYDPNGGRILKETRWHRTFSRKTDQTIYVGRLYEEEQRDNVTEKRHFIYGPAGRLVAVITDSRTVRRRIFRPPVIVEVRTTHFVHGDHLGSITAVTAEDGRVLQRIAYDPFGAIARMEGGDGVSSVARRAFLGRGWDAEVGVLDFGARLLDPELGRFLTTDPVLDFELGRSQYNPYSYAANNPLNLVDETGTRELTGREKLLQSGLESAGWALVGIALSPPTSGTSLALTVMSGNAAFVQLQVAATLYLSGSELTGEMEESVEEATGAIASPLKTAATIIGLAAGSSYEDRRAFRSLVSIAEGLHSINKARTALRDAETVKDVIAGIFKETKSLRSIDKATRGLDGEMKRQERDVDGPRREPREKKRTDTPVEKESPSVQQKSESASDKADKTKGQTEKKQQQKQPKTEPQHPVVINPGPRG